MKCSLVKVVPKTLEWLPLWFPCVPQIVDGSNTPWPCQERRHTLGTSAPQGRRMSSWPSLLASKPPLRRWNLNWRTACWIYDRCRRSLVAPKYRRTISDEESIKIVLHTVSWDCKVISCLVSESDSMILSLKKIKMYLQ